MASLAELRIGETNDPQPHPPPLQDLKAPTYARTPGTRQQLQLGVGVGLAEHQSVPLLPYGTGVQKPKPDLKCQLQGGTTTAKVGSAGHHPLPRGQLAIAAQRKKIAVSSWSETYGLFPFPQLHSPSPRWFGWFVDGQDCRPVFIGRWYEGGAGGPCEGADDLPLTGTGNLTNLERKAQRSTTVVEHRTMVWYRQYRMYCTEQKQTTRD